MAEPESARKKRMCLKMEDKQKVIDAIKAGKHVEDITREYGISKSQTYRIFQRKDSIVRAVTEGSVPTQSKVVVNKAKYPVIDPSSVSVVLLDKKPSAWQQTVTSFARAYSSAGYARGQSSWHNRFRRI